VNDFLRKMMFGFLTMGVLVSVSIAVKCSIPKYRAWRINVAQCDQLQAEVEEIRDEITQTKRNIDRFKTSPYFVERLARMNHRVADNEIVFIFQ
jgi:cell division protein FtsB